jgi:hypothetical protein
MLSTIQLESFSYAKISNYREEVSIFYAIFATIMVALLLRAATGAAPARHKYYCYENILRGNELFPTQ